MYMQAYVLRSTIPPILLVISIVLPILWPAVSTGICSNRIISNRKKNKTPLQRCYMKHTPVNTYRGSEVVKSIYVKGNFSADASITIHVPLYILFVISLAHVCDLLEQLAQVLLRFEVGAAETTKSDIAAAVVK